MTWRFFFELNSASSLSFLFFAETWFLLLVHATVLQSSKAEARVSHSELPASQREKRRQGYLQRAAFWAQVGFFNTCASWRDLGYKKTGDLAAATSSTFSTEGEDIEFLAKVGSCVYLSRNRFNDFSGSSWLNSLGEMTHFVEKDAPLNIAGRHNCFLNVRLHIITCFLSVNRRLNRHISREISTWRISYLMNCTWALTSSQGSELSCHRTTLSVYSFFTYSIWVNTKLLTLLRWVQRWNRNRALKTLLTIEWIFFKLIDKKWKLHLRLYVMLIVAMKITHLFASSNSLSSSFCNSLCSFLSYLCFLHFHWSFSSPFFTFSPHFLLV